LRLSGLYCDEIIAVILWLLEDNIKMDLQEVEGEGMEWGNGENYIMRSLMICVYQILFG
jgi:hypothetical protein